MTKIAIEKIIVLKGRRPLDQEKVAEIAASIKDIGLLSPIGVRSLDSKAVEFTQGKVELVFGAHRLAACQRLGLTDIEVVEVDSCAGAGDEDDAFAKLAEIAENLFRANLTIQQRNEHLALWVEWREKFGLTPISDSESPISGKPGRKPSRAIAAAAKMSGLTPKTVKQAIRTTKVSPEVKAAADAAELTSKQRLAVARLAEDQRLDGVAEIAADERNRAEAEARAKGATKPSGRSAKKPEPPKSQAQNALAEFKVAADIWFSKMDDDGKREAVAYAIAKVPAPMTLARAARE